MKNSMKLLLLLPVLFFVVLFQSCSSKSSPTNPTADTPTNTPAATSTSSPTNTSSNSPTSTASLTPSATSSRTPTNTPTSTTTGTSTASPTLTTTSTAVFTSTSSDTSTPTPSTTDNPTSTPTGTPTSTFTITDTPVFSYTPTDSPTDTTSPTVTDSPTLTGTSTFSSTPTDTATLSPTSSSTSTGTDTATPTITSTPTDSPTQMDSPTPTNSATLTPTFTPSNTATMTATKTATNTATPTNTACSNPCTFMINGCENLTENGNWNTNGNSTLSLSTVFATQGTQSLDVDITTGSKFNKIAILDHFVPNDFTNAVSLAFDYQADASVTTTGYCQFFLQADMVNTAGTSQVFGVNFSSSNPNVVSGSTQTALFGLQYPASGGPWKVTKIYFILNEANATTGNVYIDNIRILYCPTCAAFPTPVVTWDFEAGLTDSYGTWSMIPAGVASGVTYVGTSMTTSTPGQDSNTCMDITATFSAANQQAGDQLFPGTAINGSTFNGLRAWVWMDSSCDSGGFPGAQLQLGDGTHFPQSSFQSIVLNGWAELDFPVSSWGSLNSSNITMIKPTVNLGGSIGTLGTGHVKFDNIEFY